MLLPVKRYLRNSLVIKNIFSLSVIQVGNYIFPLITIPFLSRILEPDNFGLIMFAQTFVSYFTLLVNFGFDYTATREIAVSGNDKKKLSEIFSSVILSKIILFFFSCLAITSLCFSAVYLREHIVLILLTHIVNLGFVIFPTWFLQGMQNLATAGLFNLLIKFLYATGIFIFVNSPGDYLLANCMFAGAQVVAGIASFIYSIKSYQITLIQVPLKKVWNFISEGFLVFLSQITISLYTSSGIVLLGFYAEEIQTGYYSAVLKIWTVIQGVLLIPFNQSFFPHISLLFKSSARTAHRQLMKALHILVGITAASAVLVYWLADSIVLLIFGMQYHDAAILLKIISPLPLIVAFSNVYGLQGLIPLKADRSFLIITGSAGLISIILNLFLIPRYGMYATAIILVATEIGVSVLFYIMYKKTINLRINPWHEGV